MIWALLYYGLTLGSSSSATIGMRMMDIEMRTWYGAPCYFVLGAVHAIGYWISVSMLTPFVILIGLFQHRANGCCTICCWALMVINNAGPGDPNLCAGAKQAPWGTARLFPLCRFLRYTSCRAVDRIVEMGSGPPLTANLGALTVDSAFT